MTSITMSGNDFLMGSGIKSAQFPNRGDQVVGAVTREPEVQQQVDYDTNKPLFWEDGKPRLQAKIVLQTGERDPEDPQDDGMRAVYIKGQLQKAVAAAVRAAGATRIEVGGLLTVTYMADGEKKSAKLNAPKIYTAEYVKPDVVTQVADPVDAGTAGADKPPAGIDPASWAPLSDAQKATLRAAMAG